MTCGCSGSKQSDIDNKKLGIGDIQNLSLGQIIGLYGQGYTLQDDMLEKDMLRKDDVAPISPYLLPKKYGFMSDSIESMQTYSQVCTGSPTSDIYRALSQQGGIIVQRGRAHACRIVPTSRCLDFILFSGVKRYANYNVHFEIRQDSGGLPSGTPGSTTGRITDIIVPYSDIPTTHGPLSVTFATILPVANVPYWIVVYSADYVCDSNVSTPGNERIEFSFSFVNTTVDRAYYGDILPAPCEWHFLQYSWAFEAFKLTYSPPLPGSLRFITNPTQVDVYIDTTLKGTTDATTGILTIGNLDPISTSYTVKKSGYDDKSGNITVASNVTTDVNVTLSPVSSTGGADGTAILVLAIGALAVGYMTMKGK